MCIYVYTHIHIILFTAQVNEAMKMVDADGSGTLDFEELGNIIVYHLTLHYSMP